MLLACYSIFLLQCIHQHFLELLQVNFFHDECLVFLFQQLPMQSSTIMPLVQVPSNSTVTATWKRNAKSCWENDFKLTWFVMQMDKKKQLRLTSALSVMSVSSRAAAMAQQSHELNPLPAVISFSYSADLAFCSNNSS